MKMDTFPDIQHFATRYNELRKHQDSQDQLITQLLLYANEKELSLRNELDDVKARLRDAQLEYEAARSRRDSHQHLYDLQQSKIKILSQELDDLRNSNPYVLVLIDGDGLLFREHIIRQGIEGGKQAAYALRSIVLDQCGELRNIIDVQAKVILNLSGLARAMKRDGCIETENELEEFSLGFTQALSSFDFIDVGYGKERADSKIRELTRWNIKNVNCRQVLLGISHDNGYAPFLDEILRDDHTRELVSVLEGVPTAREILATNVHVNSNFSVLFRADKLVADSTYHAFMPAPSSPSTSTPPMSKVAAAAAAASPSVASPALAGSGTDTGTGTPSPVLSNSTPLSSYANISTPSMTYATITTTTTTTTTSRVAPPPVLALPMGLNPGGKSGCGAKKSSPTSPPASAWSPGPRGPDPNINLNQMALENIKKRKDSDKLCNNHYLRGPCTKQDCQFEHKYRPNPEEIKAIAFLTRMNPCSNGQDCDTENCIYGHHCPSVKEGLCTHPLCRYAVEAHPPNTKFKNPKITDNKLHSTNSHVI